MNAITRPKGGGFALQPNSMSEAMEMAQMLASSQMVPQAYQQKPQDTLVAMMMGSELGLNPIQALQNIAVINGKPAIYGDALLALVQSHPAFGGHEESFDDASMAATCTVWRKGDAKPHTVTFSQADAERAKLWGKAGPWQTYPKRMLMWRARGYALRDKFADALGGLITVEEAQDIPTEREIYPAGSEPARPALEHYPADSFNANFPKWRDAIEAGKRTPEQIINMVSSKAELSEEQKQQILEVAA
ncbi:MULTISPECIES: recombinase RecT [unclassified Halomonas]|uniref:recombinase RecT n=1 Tax=unclassified Halomonas TaxID=2609666 RepID=UPI001C998D75|nr:recombinase RecT [Halomonas sp. DP5N14-9]MBY5943096.1 recombinase RecT [Halomonas sp. DP5N14-9]